MTDTLKKSTTTPGPLDHFSEWNPNPIIQLSIKGDLLYLNLAARGRFPTLVNMGLIHPIIFGLKNQVQEMLKIKGDFVIFSREISFSNCIYEEQIFSVAQRDSIFIYLTDISAQKQSEKQSQKKNQLMNEFLTQASQELSQLLKAFIGFSGSFQEGGLSQLNEQQNNTMEDILQSGKHLQQIIHDLAEVNRENPGLHG